MELGEKFGVRRPYSSGKRKNKKWGDRGQKDREKGGRGETGSKKLTLDKFFGELYIYLIVYNLFCGG